MRVAPAALLVVTALAACGYKGPPVAPELVRPSSPLGFRAVSTPAGIELRWSRPSRYTSGRRMRDLGAFEILRAEGDDPAREFTVVERIELDDQTRFRPEDEFRWTDRDVTPGVRYRYRLVAITLDDYRSQPATLRARWRPGPAAPDDARDDVDAVPPDAVP